MSWRKVVLDCQDGLVKASGYYDTGLTPYVEVPQYQPSFLPAQASSGLLPAAVRYLSGDQKTIVIERPPGYHTLAYTQMYMAGARNHKLYRIPVPWQVYILRITNARSQPQMTACVRPTPLQSLQDPLYVYPLPNVDNDGRVCIHVEGTWPAFAKDHPNTADRAMWMINALWVSGFNENIHYSFDKPRHPKEFHPQLHPADKHKSFERLEKVTVPEVVTWTYPDSGRSLEAAIKNMEMTYDDYGYRAGGGLLERLANDVYHSKARP